MSLASLGPSNPMYWHLLVEAKKLAYADLLAKNADPKFCDVRSELLSKSPCRRALRRINPNVASKISRAAGAPRAEPSPSRRQIDGETWSP